MRLGINGVHFMVIHIPPQNHVCYPQSRRDPTRMNYTEDLGYPQFPQDL
jgi:hypothetical protein